MIKNKKLIYISLADAAKHCDYSQDYLSLRARQGKLKAVKMGRNWVTRQEWLNEYIAKFSDTPVVATAVATDTVDPMERTTVDATNVSDISADGDEPFISLQQASNLCEHSQEYLSLRARQGKLEAVKLGRNWVTKKTWVLAYVNKTNGKIATPTEEEQQIFVPEFVIGREKVEVAVSKPKQRSSLADQNLTDEIKEEIQEAQKVTKRESDKKFVFSLQPARRMLIAATCALVFISMISIGVVYRQPIGRHISKVFEGGIMAGESIGRTANNAIGDTVKNIMDTVKDTGIGYAINTKNTLDKVKDIGIGYAINIKNMLQGNRGVATTKQASGFLNKQIGIIKKGGICFYNQFAEGLSNIPSMFTYYISSDIKTLRHITKNGFGNLLTKAPEVPDFGAVGIENLQKGLKDYTTGISLVVKSQFMNISRFFSNRMSVELELVKSENQKIKNSIISFVGNEQ